MSMRVARPYRSWWKGLLYEIAIFAAFLSVLALIGFVAAGILG